MFRISACLILVSTTLWTSAAAAAAYANDSQIINENECTVTETTEYGYNVWFDLAQSSAAYIVSGVQLKFYVQAKDNAHVMLSKGPSTPGYEIVIGAGFNTYCDIRKGNSAKGKFNSVKTIMTNEILNATRPVGFWIRVSRGSGLIEVGKAGEKSPFMYWTDPDPVPVEYFSFSSWYGSLGKWLFKCKIDVPSSAPFKLEIPDHVTKFLTATERLRRDLLKNRGKFGVGNPMSDTQQLLIVAMTGDFRFIHLDVMTSTLTLRGQAIFEWVNPGIRWDPRSYSNISKLHLAHYELWRPELVLHNALDPTASLFSESRISVDSTGRVVWNPKFDIKTKCDVDLKSWPWDRHKCSLTMSPWSHKISNVFYDMTVNNRSKCLHESHTDWKLDSMKSYYVVDDQTPWDEVIATVVGEDQDKLADDFKQVSLKLTVEISRSTKILEKLFYVPLLRTVFAVISGLWLSSFCVMTNPSSKITIICVSIILSTSIIVYMTTYVPVFAEYPPDLLVGYLKLTLMMSTDAFVSAFLITVHSRKTTSGHPPFALTRLLTTPAVTRLLVLPKLDYAPAGHKYHSRLVQDDDGSEGTRPTTNAVITLWDVVIAALERLVFAAYFVTTVIVLSSIGRGSVES